MNSETKESVLAFGGWFDKNKAIVEEGIDLYKQQLQHDRSYLWIMVLIFSAFLFSLVTANSVFQQAHPTLFSLKTENISPNTYNLITCAYLALLILVSTSRRFSRYTKLVRFGLDWASYSGAVMFGLLLGDIAHIVTISGDIQEIHRGAALIAFFLFQTAFLLSMLYFFARAVDAESVNNGFMNKWWAASPILRYGFSLSVVSLAGFAMMSRSLIA